MVKSLLKTWEMTEELELRVGYETESDEFDDLMR
jgi:hypothetical protein